MNLDTPARRQRLQELADLYSELLTPSQRATLALHVDKDWSYAEIASAQNVSRAAAHDQVRRAEAALEGYEQKLGLLDRSRRDGARVAQLQERVAQLQLEVAELRASGNGSV
jgi:predicted DNA-binding protein YlxM (UPF0122 family)